MRSARWTGSNEGETGADGEAVRRSWDALADDYASYCGSEVDVYRTEVIAPGLLRACGDVAGLRVLDLGCGTGYFTRLLAHAGAEAVGVDISERQIHHARAHEDERPLGITYHALDAAAIGDRWGPRSFELIASCIALQDMPDPSSVLQGAHRVLTPGGRVVVLVEHPMNVTAFREWERRPDGGKIALRVDRYFDTGARVGGWSFTGPDGRSQEVSFPTWARTLEEWSTLFADAGFLIARLHEPHPTPEQVERVPDLDDSSRIPYFVVFDLVC